MTTLCIQFEQISSLYGQHRYGRQNACSSCMAGGIVMYMYMYTQGFSQNRKKEGGNSSCYYGFVNSPVVFSHSVKIVVLGMFVFRTAHI